MGMGKGERDNPLKTLLLKLKRAHKSLTIWFNAIVGTLILSLPELLAYAPQLKEYLPDDIYKKAMFLLVFGNFLLRIRTSKDLADK
jgi:hypothetical protein